MEEWLSYRLDDLILFSEQSFFRQFYLYKLWLGDVHWAAYFCLPLLFFVIYSNNLLLRRLYFALLAVAFLVCAYGYFWQYYSAINWVAKYFVYLFILQALLILWSGLRAPVGNWQFDSRAVGTILGIVLIISTVIFQPLLEWRSLQGWQNISPFLLSPDSLSFVALASVLFFKIPVVNVIPIGIWLLFSALTYVAMDHIMMWFPIIGHTVFLVFLLSKGRARP